MVTSTSLLGPAVDDLAPGWGADAATEPDDAWTRRALVESDFPLSASARSARSFPTVVTWLRDERVDIRSSTGLSTSEEVFLPVRLDVVVPGSILMGRDSAPFPELALAVVEEPALVLVEGAALVVVEEPALVLIEGAALVLVEGAALTFAGATTLALRTLEGLWPSVRDGTAEGLGAGSLFSAVVG